jgi:predicted transcriptional regulator
MAQKPLYNSHGEQDLSKRATISLPLKDYNKLEKMANKKRVSIAWIIRDAVTEYITGEKNEY